MNQYAFRFTLSLLVSFLLLLASTHAKEVKVFAIGNSFARDATRQLEQIVEDRGHEIVIRIANKGACSLQQHAEALEKSLANPDDPEAQIYHGKKSLIELLSGETWDVITLQQYSFLSGDPSTYQPYSSYLYEYLKETQSEAELVWHQTWSYRRDADKFGRIAPDQQAKDQREMLDHSRKAYHEIAKSLGTRIIPSGDALWRADADPVWGFVPQDEAFQFPDLPEQRHSLHIGYLWKKDETLRKDANHASPAGQYLAGLIWYGFLFEESPLKVEYAPENMDPEYAAFLRRVAAETLRSNK